MSFIVINDTLGAATHLLKRSNEVWAKVPKLGVLMHDEHVITDFPTRERAKRAIERTDAYHAKRGTPNRQRMVYRIIRLVPEDLGK